MVRSNLQTPVYGERAFHEIETPSPNLTAQNAWRKIDVSLLPILVVFYVLDILDITNLSNARIAGIQTEINMSDSQFSMIATIASIAHLFSSFPLSIALRILGPHIVLPTLMTLWGIVTTLQGIAKNYAQLLVCHFLIWLLDGGFFPCITLYLSSWYLRRQLQRRVSIIMAPAALTGEFSGLLAYGIVRMDGVGNRPGWAWIFILEGLVTIPIGVLGFFVLPRSPDQARFLTKEEKEFVTVQLRESGATSRHEAADNFSWKEVRKAFELPHVWMIAPLFFFKSTLASAMGLFLPSIVENLGYEDSTAQLYTAPPIAVAFVFTLAVSLLSDKIGKRGFVFIACIIVTTAGVSIFLGSRLDVVRYGSLFLTLSGINAASPILWTWSVNNVAPYTRRATAISFAAFMSNAGSILGKWLFGPISPGPMYTKGSIIVLTFCVLMVILAGLKIVYFTLENRKKAAIRSVLPRQDEKSELGDRSAWFVYSL